MAYYVNDMSTYRTAKATKRWLLSVRVGVGEFQVLCRMEKSLHDPCFTQPNVSTVTVVTVRIRYGYGLQTGYVDTIRYGVL